MLEQQPHSMWDLITTLKEYGWYKSNLSFLAAPAGNRLYLANKAMAKLIYGAGGVYLSFKGYGADGDSGQ